MSNPPPQGRPRSMLDSGTPRRTMVLRHPKPAHISLTARRAQQAGPPPTQPTTTPSYTNANARNQRPPLDNALSISERRPDLGWGVRSGCVDGLGDLLLGDRVDHLFLLLDHTLVMLAVA